MPIHTSYKHLVKGMAKQYPGKKKCRKFTDGSEICASAKAWQVFYSYLNKKGWDDTKAMLSNLSLEDKLKLFAELTIRDGK